LYQTYQIQDRATKLFLSELIGDDRSIRLCAHPKAYVFSNAEAAAQKLLAEEITGMSLELIPCL
jgi:hypothetical protein